MVTALPSPPPSNRALRRPADMTRLWDKGAPLDDRVLQYTAGEDYALDERLVRYDVRASIAHAEMLNAQKLLSDSDLAAIRAGLTAIGEQHSRGEWRIELTDEELELATGSMFGFGFPGFFGFGFPGFGFGFGGFGASFAGAGFFF